MSLRTLVVLLIILVVLVGVAVWQSARRAEVGGPAPGARVLPDLDVNAIHRIEIAAAGSTSVVERQEGRWLVSTLHRYPADFGKVVEALRGLSELEVGQIVRDADQYPAEFGLAEDSPSVRVTLIGGRDEPWALTLGEFKREGGAGGFPGYESGRYLRTPAGAVVLVSDPLRGWTAVSDDWIRKDLLSLPAGEIEQITVNVSNSEYTLLVKRPGQFEVAGLKAGEETEAGAASRLANAFEYLRCETVADPSMEEPALGFENPARCVARTRDHREYTVQIGGAAPDGGRYLRIGAAYHEPPAPTEEEVAREFPPEEKAKPAEGEPAAAPEKTREEKIREALDRRVKAHQEQVTAGRKTVEEQAAAWKGWTFVVAGYAADALVQPRENLVKKTNQAPDSLTEETSQTME